MTKPHRKNRSIRLDDEEWATLRDDLGIGWLRTQIEQAKSRKAQSYLLEALEALVSADSVTMASAMKKAEKAIDKARGEP